MSKKHLKLVADNTQKQPLTQRDATALALCRNVLENCGDEYNDRIAITPAGEVLTFSSAVEVLDTFIEKGFEEK